MQNENTIIENESGFILVLAMVMLVVLTLIAVSATRTTTIELKIAGNERLAQEAFYKADGGTEVGIETLEQNFSCPIGFSKPSGFDDDDATTSYSLFGIDIFDSSFAYDDAVDDLAGVDTAFVALTADQKLVLIPSDSIRSLKIPVDPAKRTDADLHTNLAIYGRTNYAHGNAIQMAAGNRGLGFGAAGGGGINDMNVIALYTGNSNTVSKIHLDYVHLIGTEGSCLY